MKTLSLLGLALTLSASTAHAYTIETPDGFQAWWDAEEVVLRVDPQLERELGKDNLRQSLEIAVDAWRGFGHAPTVKISQWPARPYSEFSDENSVVWGYGYPWKHELAMTILKFNEDGSLRKATIAINPEWASKLELFQTLTAAPVRFDLASILTHEMGHVLGMRHSDDERAVMSSSLKPGETRRQLAEDDERGIEALYPEMVPMVTVGGCSAAPRASNQGCFWGGLVVVWWVRRHPRKRPSIR